MERLYILFNQMSIDKIDMTKSEIILLLNIANSKYHGLSLWLGSTKLELMNMSIEFFLE